MYSTFSGFCCDLEMPFDAIPTDSLGSHPPKATSGSYEKTANFVRSEPRMESVSNNSVKNTAISARSCLVESLSCIVG